jgi:hypothetical protein
MSDGIEEAGAQAMLQPCISAATGWSTGRDERDTELALSVSIPLCLVNVLVY